MVEVERLKKFGLFKGLNEDEMKHVCKILSATEVAENEVLLKENQITRSIFLIEKGEASIYLKKGMKEELIRVNKPGEMFGEMSFLDGKLHSANVRANSTMELFIMRKNDFDTLISDNPRIGVKLYQNFVRVLLDMVRQTNRKVKELMK